VTALPYAGETGRSGTGTSAARATARVRSGAAAEQQDAVLELLRRVQRVGVIVKELEKHYGWHHGSASAVLSNLHKVGTLARLENIRDNCKVYVLPEFVDGRETEVFGRRRAANRIFERGAAAPGSEIRAVVDTWGTLHQHCGKRWRSCKDGGERAWDRLPFPLVAVPVPNPELR
jgi:hypothetical protein